MNKESIILFLSFLFLVSINFIIGLLVADYGIKLLNFIALELLNKKDFYVFDTRNSGFGIFMWHSIATTFWLLFAYSILCYWLCGKYKGIKYFLIILVIFIIYFSLFCLFFRAYRFLSFLLHFIPFCLMYMEIILLHRIKR